MATPITQLNEAIPLEHRRGDGVSKDFYVAWGVKTGEDLEVLFGEPGVGSDIPWQVRQPENSDGFTLRFDTPPDDGTLITIARSTPVARHEDYGQENEFVAEAINRELASHILMMQEIDSKVGRALTLAPTDTSEVPIYLPPQAERADHFLGFDAAGNPIALKSDGTFEAEFDIDTYPYLDHLEPSFRLLVDTSGGTKKTTVAVLEDYLRALAIGQPVITAETIGLKGDWDGTTGTDDAPALQKAYDKWSTAPYRGAVFMLRSPVDKAFYLAGRVRGGTNINTIFHSPVALAPGAALELRGSYAARSGLADAQSAGDVAQGATSMPIDTSPLGGGALSTWFAVGDVVRIDGLLDSAGTAVEQQVLRVTSVDDGTGILSFAEPLDYAFEQFYPHAGYWDGWARENRTRIRLCRSCEVIGDALEGSETINCDPVTVGRLRSGSWVLVEDEKRQSDVRGSATGRIHREIARILRISGNYVVLDRKLARTYEAAFHARLVDFNPIRGATIQGALIEYTATASTSILASVRMQFAVSCAIAGSRVPNADAFGNRGPGFEMYLSLNSEVVECAVERPKFIAEGEGYGFVLSHSSSCNVRACAATGCRHSVLWKGATDCNAYEMRSHDCRLTDLDWHGCDEVACTAYEPEVWGGLDSRTAFAFGNSTGLNGCRHCGVQGGEVSNYLRSGSYAVTFEPSVSHCYVRGTSFRNIYRLCLHTDVAGYGSLVAIDNSIDNITVDGCTDFLLELRGGHNGSVNRTCRDFRVTNCVFANIGKLVHAIQVDEFILKNCVFEDIIADPSYPFAVYLSNAVNISLERNTWRRTTRGVRAQDSTGRIHHNSFLDLVGNPVFEDLGNNALKWRGTIVDGFTPTVTRAAGSVVQEYPRSLAPVIVANDAVMILRPEQERGLCTLIDASGNPIVQFSFKTGAGNVAPVTLWQNAGITFVLGTGILGAGGTGGTDNAINICTHTDGLLYIKNRDGLLLTLDVIWS